MEVSTGSYRTRNGWWRVIPWKIVIPTLVAGGVATGGGMSVWDAIAQVKADSAKALEDKQEDIITPLQVKVEKHADSISALDKAVGVVATEVTNIKENIRDMKSDIDDLGDRFDNQEDMQHEILRLLQQQINGDSAGRP